MSETESLRADVCWDLLRSVPVGRLAVIVDDRPAIFRSRSAAADSTSLTRPTGRTY
jgi:hypothetical protein